MLDDLKPRKVGIGFFPIMGAHFDFGINLDISVANQNVMLILALQD